MTTATWATVDTHIGPFTAVVDADGAVLASGWTASLDELLPQVHPTLRPAELVQGERQHHLLLDGKRIYLRTDSDQVVDLLRNTRQPVFLICLSDAVRRLRVDVGSLELEQPQRKPVETTSGTKLKRRTSDKPASA